MSTTQYEYENGVEPNAISFHPGGDEMLRITPEGFWVRGVKVPQDDREARAVYNAFREFLVWAELKRP